MQFEDFQHKLQVVLGMKKEGIYSLSDRDHKLRLSDALFCAEDIVRNRKFFVAIQKALQNLGDEVVVIDAGAGTGVLGIMTLIHGAKHCTFIEENPYTMELCKQVVESFGYTHRSDFLL
ncbi:MAG: RsmD family RNA methyltransferase [Candidatus Peribacteria bacterium]|nr:MAG: RsmD family RNA methyltransferase [Candidatus Peribacteria bacterium]